MPFYAEIKKRRLNYHAVIRSSSKYEKIISSIPRRRRRKT